MRRETTYRFLANLKCHTDAGTECLRDYRISVHATDLSTARLYIQDVAFNLIADAGSDLLDGNLLSIEVNNLRAL